MMSVSAAGDMAAAVTLKALPDMRVLYSSAWGQMGQHHEERLARGGCLPQKAPAVKLDNVYAIICLVIKDKILGCKPP